MNRRVLACAGALIVAAAMYVSGAQTERGVADAAMRGDTAAVRALLQKKADVNAPQVDGATALHW
ncbi:MAG TPA: ankyrin repeat domain-containing protein, partial [Vicinamibacterales bacterium]|nr:ankyrin repeat domain-containing protein [Vicinamibacterales bacterium]